LTDFSGRFAALTRALRSSCARAALAARGGTPAAFAGRCIPADGAAPPANIPDILGRRALSAGRLSRLGATRVFHRGLLVALAFLILSGCGKKGPPLAPFSSSPGTPAEVTVRRKGDQVEIHFKVPVANSDGRRPAKIDHVEVYALTMPAEKVHGEGKESKQGEGGQSGHGGKGGSDGI